MIIFSFIILLQNKLYNKLSVQQYREDMYLNLYRVQLQVHTYITYNIIRFHWIMVCTRTYLFVHLPHKNVNLYNNQHKGILNQTYIFNQLHENHSSGTLSPLSLSELSSTAGGTSAASNTCAYQSCTPNVLALCRALLRYQIAMQFQKGSH